MKYLILIHDERVAFGHGHRELAADMVRAGVHVASEGLADPSLATWVSVRGEPIASGFYLIDCPSREEAVAWAARVPGAAETPVEVRPVLDMAGTEF